MYIPLFLAAYSRYSDARPDATRIISLDEAFAGVDENNIWDMFDLLKTGLAGYQEGILSDLWCDVKKSMQGLKGAKLRES